MMLPEDYINRPVRSLQTMLQVLSNVFPALLNVNPDGIYGEATQKAVRAFQRFSGLPETGIAEQETWNSLASCYLRHAPSVLPPEPLRIVLQPGQEIAPGEQNLHLFIIQAMMAALAGRFSNANPPEVTGVFDAATKKAVRGNFVGTAYGRSFCQSFLKKRKVMSISSAYKIARRLPPKRRLAMHKSAHAPAAT